MIILLLIKRLKLEFPMIHIRKLFQGLKKEIKLSVVKQQVLQVLLVIIKATKVLAHRLAAQ